MSRLTRDGTAEPVSRDQILRHARGQGNIIFPVQLATSRTGNLTRLIHTLLYVMTIYTYILFAQAPILVWFDGTIFDISTILLQCTTVVMLGYDWWLCMVINIRVQYDGGFLPDIILLTQGYYHRGTRLNTM